MHQKSCQIKILDDYKKVSQKDSKLSGYVQFLVDLTMKSSVKKKELENYYKKTVPNINTPTKTTTTTTTKKTTSTTRKTTLTTKTTSTTKKTTKSTKKFMSTNGKLIVTGEVEPEFQKLTTQIG